MSSLRATAFAVATLGAVAQRVADSVDPSCKAYKGFAVELDWSTDCMTSEVQTGHVALSEADSNQRVAPQTLVSQAAVGGLTLAAA